MINGDVEAVAQATGLLAAVEQLASEDKKGQAEVNMLSGNLRSCGTRYCIH